MAFEHKFLTCTSHVNSNLEVRNKTLLEWMEDIGSLHSDEARCGMKDIEETRLSWVIIQWKVKVHRRFRYGETITIKTWVSGMKRMYTFREYEFYDEEGKLVVSACGKWVLTHLEEGVIGVPPEIVASYGSCNDTAFEEGNNMPRPKDPMDFSTLYRFKVPCTFIDVNGHVNNIFYLDIAYQALPEEVFRNSTFDEFEVLYRKECKQDDNLMCYYHFDGESHIVSVRSEDSKQLHVLLKLK